MSDRTWRPEGRARIKRCEVSRGNWLKWLERGLILALVGVFLFCTADTVRGQEALDVKEREAFYRAQEEQLLRQTRCLLREQGFGDSGVTLNRVVEREERIYTFTIHHRRLDDMEEGKRRETVAALEEDLRTLTVEFPGAAEGANCVFVYEFMIL